MESLADRFATIIEQMKESDRRTEELIKEHLTRTRQLLNELGDLDKTTTV